MEKELICEMTIAELERIIYEMKKAAHVDKNPFYDIIFNLWEKITREFKLRRVSDKNTRIWIFLQEDPIPGTTQTQYSLIIQPVVPSQFTCPDAVEFQEVAAKNINIRIDNYPEPGHDKQHGQSFIFIQSIAEFVINVKIYFSGTVPVAF